MFTRNTATLLIFVFLFITWVCYNTLTKTVNMPYIPSYRNLSHYIIPEKDTSLILPESQCNGDVFLVVVVCSAVLNFKSRDAIRKTWGQHATSQGSIQIYFLLGKSISDEDNSAVANEGNEYLDIIQEDFLDTYNNLTVKSVMLLKWVNQNCRHAKYVLKSDDDMFVHLPNLVNVLEVKRQPNMLLGFFLNESIPIRDLSSKHYAPENAFSKQKYYPPYFCGAGYVFSGNAVPSLYRASLEVEFFYVEDIFITGVCAGKIGLHPYHDGRFAVEYQRSYARKKECCMFNSLITAHNIASEDLLRIWQTCFQHVMSQSYCPSSTNSISYFANSSFMIVFYVIILSMYAMLATRSFSF